jgi:hypothetical protein
MSDFFAGVTGFKFPDTLRNKGPLPSVVGGPAGSNGTPDAVINGTSSLLSNITPYAKGESARMGSDSNYQQIPWRMQYIIPQLFIPSFSEYEGSIAVSHAVDQGDIAFRLYTKDRPWFTSNSSPNAALRPAALVSFGNLDIVNYILTCLQHSTSSTWDSVRGHLRYNRSHEEAAQFKAIRRLVRQNFTPHGICAGSEHQGGKHEQGSHAPIQSGRAVNFVTTMTVDGKNEDLVNYWCLQDLSAGDTLLFTIEKQTQREINSRSYQLTRYYKQPVKSSIHLEDESSTCWQLVARVHRFMDELPAPADRAYDYRVAGYWRIAQTFQCRRASQNIRGQTNGPLLEVTFAPVWMDFSFCTKTQKRARASGGGASSSPREGSPAPSARSGISHPDLSSGLTLPDAPLQRSAGAKRPQKRQREATAAAAAAAAADAAAAGVLGIEA